MNAEILAVGTELLLGNTANTDARDLSELLAAMGINVFWHTVVGDNPQRLRDAVAIARGRADLIITTGGLGPTCDDLTKQVLAEAFGLGLEFHEDVGEGLRVWYESRHNGLPFPENNLRQAYLPAGCTVFYNEWGSAPGCAFEANGIRVLMLPGPPGECIPMFRACAMPYLSALTGETICSHNLRMVGIGEARMEELLRDLMDDHPNPSLAPYSKPGECSVRVTAKAATAEECEEMMEPVIEEVKARIGEFIYGTDVDSIEQAVNTLLGEKGMTLAAAESCTGGLLAKRMTDIPGSSAHFKGGVTVYTEEAKCTLLGLKQSYIDKHGVVSAAVAKKLAKRVRKTLKADFGVGITGWAGPDGDDVGLVYVALAAKDACFVRQLNCGQRVPRERVRTIAVNNALDMVRRSLSGLEI